MSARLSIATPHRRPRPATSVVGIEPEQRRHVERRRQAVAAGADDLLEPPVGVVGGSEAGEHPHRPQLRAVHRRVGAAGVGVDAGELAVVGAVDRLERDAGHRGRSTGTQRRVVERVTPDRGCRSRLDGTDRTLRRPSRSLAGHADAPGGGRRGTTRSSGRSPRRRTRACSRPPPRTRIPGSPARHRRCPRPTSG
jgi:hypothetical protein